MAAWQNLNGLLGNERHPYSKSIISTFIDPHTVYATHQFAMKRKNRNVSVWATSVYQDSYDETEVVSEPDVWTIKRAMSSKPKETNDNVVRQVDSPKRQTV
jgi:hypothetical protein